MKHRILFLLISLSVVVHAQTDHWTKVWTGDLQCDFPKAFTPLDYYGASGVFYDGGNVYLTVTTLPDTFPMKGSLDRDFTYDFMTVVADVAKKLQNGRVREFRDTVIANMPGYISTVEVTFKDGRKSMYELLQVLHQDSIRSFSCQYYLDDPEGPQVCRRVFQSVRYAPGSRPATQKGKAGLWIGGSVIALFGVIWFAWRRFRPH